MSPDTSLPTTDSPLRSEDKSVRHFFRASSADFKKIPGSPIAYWFSGQELKAFEGSPIHRALKSEGAVKTGDNEKFVRLIWEVPHASVSINGPWRKHPKGGSFRKWYGNLDSIVRWDSEARNHYRNDHISRIPVESVWNVRGITWTAVSSSTLSFRIEYEDEIANNAALFVYPKVQGELFRYLGLLNAKTSRIFLEAISPTLNFLVGDVLAIPDTASNATNFKQVELITQSAIKLARTDWNNFETSWDFQNLPILRDNLKAKTLAASWANWDRYCRDNLAYMKELEEENNRLWIEAYGLQDELTPEVLEKEITLARAEVRRDMAALLSYAVGCMMGRYSLDAPGLILANAGDTVEDYDRIVAEKRANPGDQTQGAGVRGQDSAGKIEGTGDSEEIGLLTPDPCSLTPPFRPDTDGIIPVLDGEWFEDDIVARTREFLRVTFGEATLNENLRFIEQSLGKTLEKYFLTDFYKDHLQTYKKRPIYWLFQSPKKGFSALVYLHRYTKDTANTLLNKYLREYLHKLRARIEHLEFQDASGNLSAKEKKEIDKLRKTLHECEEWEREVLLPLAQQRLEIDLDDGVKQNYPKFGKALAKVAGLS